MKKALLLSALVLFMFLYACAGVDTIIITTEPEGATLTVDNQNLGRTPAKFGRAWYFFGLAGQSQQIEISKKGFITIRRQITNSEINNRYWVEGDAIHGSELGYGNTFAYHFVLEPDSPENIGNSVSQLIYGYKGVEWGATVKEFKAARPDIVFEDEDTTEANKEDFCGYYAEITYSFSDGRWTGMGVEIESDTAYDSLQEECVEQFGFPQDNLAKWELENIFIGFLDDEIRRYIFIRFQPE